MIYRHKPKSKVVAFRWGFEELPIWIEKDDRVREVKTPSINYLEVFTSYGLLRCMPGDYIVLGDGGEFYPCDYDVFNDNYELVEDE